MKSLDRSSDPGFTLLGDGSSLVSPTAEEEGGSYGTPTPNPTDLCPIPSSATTAAAASSLLRLFPQGGLISNDLIPRKVVADEGNTHGQ
ncbi:hypothetical protein CRG98_043792 [Punica granatum]|uniref:Uncharacterized protein n=1 Tax=Punica granatum TaxID=22663 RepID=A0A2I0HVT9_PUNGR|nr:hypothetical protein CRG98_043792 [Punica granatum]